MAVLATRKRCKAKRKHVLSTRKSMQGLRNGVTKLRNDDTGTRKLDTGARKPMQGRRNGDARCLEVVTRAPEVVSWESKGCFEEAEGCFAAAEVDASWAKRRCKVSEMRFRISGCGLRIGWAIGVRTPSRPTFPPRVRLRRVGRGPSPLGWAAMRLRRWRVLKLRLRRVWRTAKGTPGPFLPSQRCSRDFLAKVATPLWVRLRGMPEASALPWAGYALRRRRRRARPAAAAPRSEMEPGSGTLTMSAPAWKLPMTWAGLSA